MLVVARVHATVWVAGSPEITSVPGPGRTFGTTNAKPVGVDCSEQLAPAFGPHENPASNNEYMAQFYNARTADPAVSATAFHSKKDNVTVLWLDGLDYLPETADLK